MAGFTLSYGRKIMKQNKAKLKLWQMLQSVRKVHNVKVLISLQIQKPFFSKGMAKLCWGGGGGTIWLLAQNKSTLTGVRQG